MINWKEIFLTSDFDNPDPVDRQNVALAHLGPAGIAMWLVLAMMVSPESAAFWVAITYTLKEVMFDLARLLVKAPRKWRGNDYRLLADSVTDWLFVFSGGLVASYIWGHNPWAALGLLLAMTAASFTYYLGRDWDDA